MYDYHELMVVTVSGAGSALASVTGFGTTRTGRRGTMRCDGVSWPIAAEAVAMGAGMAVRAAIGIAAVDGDADGAGDRDGTEQDPMPSPTALAKAMPTIATIALRRRVADSVTVLRAY